MKICYISSRSSIIPSRTANSIQVMKMCQAFAQLSHEVELVTPRVADDGSSQLGMSLWDWYGVKQMFPISWVPSSPRVRGYDFAIRSGYHAWKQRVDLVMTRDVRPALLASTLGMPTVYEVHEVPPRPVGEVLLRSLVRRRWLRAIVAISHGLRSRLERVLPLNACEKMVVLADGVDLERFAQLPDAAAARQRLGLDASRIAVGYAGHLYPGRGVELIARLGLRMKHCQFFIIGGMEPDIRRLHQWVHEKDADNIRVLGFVPNQELPMLLAACDVLLLPYQRSVAGYDGGNTADVMSPLKMFEYMAAGRPIVASDLPALREVLNERNCLFCDPENIDEWHRAIVRLTTDAEVSATLCRRAQMDVEQYSWKRRASTIIQLAKGAPPGSV